jgi:hypothetical protein
MSQESALIDKALKTPRAAAIAGIIFSVLFATSELLIRSWDRLRSWSIIRRTSPAL